VCEYLILNAVEDIEKRYSFQPYDSGRDGVFEVFKKVEGQLDIIGVEIQGFVYYIVLLEGFNSHKAWISIRMPSFMEKYLDMLMDKTQGYVEVLGDSCPLLSQSIIAGIDKRYNNGGFANIAGEWFLLRDFWFSMNDNSYSWINLSSEVNLELIDRMTQMFNEISNFKGFSWSQNAKIATKDLYNGYKRVRPYITVAKFITTV